MLSSLGFQTFCSNSWLAYTLGSIWSFSIELKQIVWRTFQALVFGLKRRQCKKVFFLFKKLSIIWAH